VSLPLNPPLAPQLARSRANLPEGDGWAYEPKYDGFRAVAFVDGDETYLQSRNGKPLSRYFPELVFPPGRYDLLALDDEVLLERSYDERRAALEAHVQAPVALTDVVRTAADAEHWLHEAEGVIAKEAAAPYLPGERTGMIKVKRVRTVDAVVMGWRPGKAERTVGALILGLYTPEGRLREVGHSSGFTAKEKRELVDFLAPYETGERGSGEASRWTQGRDLEWVSLRPELVVEITFDHVSDGRIRHGSKVQRWREDKAPEACTVDQLDQ
jgi:ATP-dependent DNA ligase